MRPKRQHHVPCCLLVGFSSRRGRAARTWYFRKGTPPVHTNIINVGVRKEFYAKPGEGDIESLLGDRESEYAPLLLELRNRPRHLNPQESARIGGFLAEMVIRSEHFRLLVDGALRDAATSLQLIENDEELLAAIIRKTLATFPEIPERVYRRTHDIPRGAALDERVVVQIKKRTARFVQGRPGRLLRRVLQTPPTDDEQVGFARAAHGVVLETLFASMESGQFASRPWSVLSFPDDSLILGNVGPLTSSAELGDLRPMIGVDSGSIVLYAIAHNRLLVSAPDASPDSIDAQTVNRAIVSMSDWFAARRKTESVMRLHSLLGSVPAVSDQVENLRKREPLIEYVLSSVGVSRFEPATS